MDEHSYAVERNGDASSVPRSLEHGEHTPPAEHTVPSAGSYAARLRSYAHAIAACSFKGGAEHSAAAAGADATSDCSSSSAAVVRWQQQLVTA